MSLVGRRARVPIHISLLTIKPHPISILLDIMIIPVTRAVSSKATSAQPSEDHHQRRRRHTAQMWLVQTARQDDEAWACARARPTYTYLGISARIFTASVGQKKAE